MIQNVDYLQGVTIVTNPTNMKGKWTAIECLDTLTGVVVVDNNRTTDSEPWTDSEFTFRVIRIGKFTEITCVGKVALYA